MQTSVTRMSYSSTKINKEKTGKDNSLLFYINATKKALCPTLVEHKRKLANIFLLQNKLEEQLKHKVRKEKESGTAINLNIYDLYVFVKNTFQIFKILFFKENLSKK